MERLTNATVTSDSELTNTSKVSIWLFHSAIVLCSYAHTLSETVFHPLSFVKSCSATDLYAGTLSPT